MNELQLWQYDQRMNDRGFQVDTELAEAAVRILNRLKKAGDERTVELTDGNVQSVTQRDALLRQLLEAHGVDLPDVQKSTIERRIDDPNLPWVVKELLLLRLDGAMASTSKYKALLRTASSDGRLRGTIQFCGAVRTGRDGGRLWQPQNLIRTPDWFTADYQEEVVDAIKSDTADLLYDNAVKLISYCCRGSIIAAPGKKLIEADLSGIEARVLPWLAGEEWKLQAFRDFDAGIGPDLYRVSAGKLLNRPADEVTKDERQSHGKVTELSCGYQGAVKALFATARLYGYMLDEREAKIIVDMWRDAHPATVAFWYELEQAARTAIEHSGTVVKVGRVAFHRWGEWLRMKLPSGRVLCYCQPAIVPSKMFAGATSVSYLGVNNYTRKWERLHTYGGKFAAEATQGTARDIMFSNIPAIEAAGYPIVLKVHDSALTEVPDDPCFTTEELCALLSTHPEWADESLPLIAGGFEAYRYRKD